MRSSLLTWILVVPGIAFSQTVTHPPSQSMIPWQTERAQQLSGTAPIYPGIAVIAQVEGCVYAAIVVSTDGTVQQPTVFVGGLALLKQSAMRAVRTWKFNPSVQQVSTVARVCFFLSGGDAKKRLVPYQKAVEKRPNDAGKLVALARELLLLGLPEEAEGCFRRALAVKSNDAEAEVGLGDSLVAKSNLDEAITSYQQWLAANPKNFMIAEFRTASEQQPGNPFYHYRLGEAYGKKGDTKRALKEYQIAVKQMPQNAEFREAYDRLARK